jgi:hypothetical protein
MDRPRTAAAHAAGRLSLRGHERKETGGRATYASGVALVHRSGLRSGDSASLRVQKKVMDFGNDLLLFESILQGGYKFIPGIADEKSGELGRSPSALSDNVMPKNIQSAPQIMERVAHQYCRVLGWKCERIKVERQPTHVLRVLLDVDTVKIVRDDSSEPSIEITDVFRSPLNLFP